MRSGRRIALAIALVVAITTIACNRAGSSPTATMKAYFEAFQKKDAEGLKKTLSKGTLDMFEQFAKAQNPPKTIDEALKTGLANTTNSTPDKMPEMKDEKIEGDKATLQVKFENGNWETIPFVKEDGAWKIAFDEMLRKQSPRS
jgi:hypothetical protein